MASKVLELTFLTDASGRLLAFGLKCEVIVVPNYHRGKSFGLHFVKNYLVICLFR